MNSVAMVFGENLPHNCEKGKIEMFWLKMNLFHTQIFHQSHTHAKLLT